MRGVKRPIPADFASLAPTMGPKALARRYGASWEIVDRWCKEAGVEALRIPARPVPDDFIENAPRLTHRGLMKRYGTSHRVIARWCDETGVRPTTGLRCDAKPVPDDFAARAPTMVRLALTKHYGVNYKTVERWLRLTGVKPLFRPVAVKTKRPPVVRVRAVRAPSLKIVRNADHRGFTGQKSAFLNRLPSLDTLEAQAANHLRRECAVYRCTERGAADPEGGFWRYGNVVLTPDEMMERAERHGWAPDAWRTIPQTQTQGVHA